MDDSARQYMCGTCDLAVTWEEKGVFCETCDQWYHSSCQNIGSQTYDKLSDSELNISWHCIVCNNANFSETVHDLFSCEVSHCFHTLGPLPNVSFSSPSGHKIRPVHSSTPNKRQSPQTKMKVPLRIVNINFQSIKFKQCRLTNVLESVNPDVVFGTETWLDRNNKDQEIFPRGYKVYRKNQAASGGGVLIAVKDEFNCKDVPELDSDCELIWAKVKLIGNGTLCLCSHYRHNVSDKESTTNFMTSVQRACSIRNASVLIGGDFNFPGWDWTCNALKPESAYPNLHIRFSDILANNSLTQLVHEPTRKANTLDLLLTNQPDQVLRVNILPGISDHGIVFAEMDFRPEKHIQKPQLIPLYKKANWGEIKEDMKALKESITSLYSSDTTDVNTIWEHFKDTLQTSLKSHIPHRRAKTKDGYPWIGPELKKLFRRQHRLYKLKKKTGDPTHKQKYLEIKHLVQRRTRQAYWVYVESKVTPQERETEYTSMKRF